MCMFNATLSSGFDADHQHWVCPGHMGNTLETLLNVSSTQDTTVWQIHELECRFPIFDRNLPSHIHHINIAVMCEFILIVSLNVVFVQVVWQICKLVLVTIYSKPYTFWQLHWIDCANIFNDSLLHGASSHEQSTDLFLLRINLCQTVNEVHLLLVPFFKVFVVDRNI